MHYLDSIEKVYIGAASKRNKGFIAAAPSIVLNYDDVSDASRLIGILRENNFTKIHIDANCIVGWAEHYYRLRPAARKADFLGDSEGRVKIIGEIRKPSVLADYIHPYLGKTNVKFNYLMDQLNDFITKKDLGAFYTPDPYAKKAVELVRKAISRVPSGNDYIILDRCAGTGNLERHLNDEELSHCILSTYEYYEYKVMVELLGDKVLEIIPPIEKEDTFMGGMVRGSDALSKDFVDNAIVAKYLNDPNVTIIMFENPPFAETTSLEHQRAGKGRHSSSQWKNSYVVQEMKKHIKSIKNVPNSASNEMSNAFIWSAFKYYLRQPTDSYVVFSPVKYWKAQHLVNKRLIDGFAGDRHHFHARKHSCVLVALWSNEDSDMEAFQVPGYDIENDNLGDPVMLDFRRIGGSFSKPYYDRRPISDSLNKGVLCGCDGLEKIGGKHRIRAFSGKDILGYMVVDGSGFDQPDLHSCLTVSGRFNGNGFYLRRDNYIEKMPLFAASRYISYINSWTERGRIMKSGDGADRYSRSVNSGKLDGWLKKCLLFTCLEMQNHMRSFVASDGTIYRNELCLDTTNGATVASEELSALKKNETEESLFEAWSNVITAARSCENYDKTKTYGVYQIDTELNTRHKDLDTGEITFDYPELNGDIKTLKELNKRYYLEEIVPFLFEYEFLK